MIIYLFLKDINHTLFLFFSPHPPSPSPSSPSIAFHASGLRRETDRGLAFFKGKSNRWGDIKKQRGSLEGGKKVGGNAKEERGIEMVIAREGDV